MFLLAGCVQPTPTPAATTGAGTAYPGQAPTLTPYAPNYPAGATPQAPSAEATPTAGPYPAPTSGALARLGPL